MSAASVVVCSRRNGWREAVSSKWNMCCTSCFTNNQVTESHIACVINKSSFIVNPTVIESRSNTTFKNRKKTPLTMKAVLDFSIRLLFLLLLLNWIFKVCKVSQAQGNICICVCMYVCTCVYIYIYI